MLGREKFDQLEKMKQLEYINETTKESGKTVNEICKIIGIAHSTLSDRFKSLGYKFNRDLKQYILKNAEGSKSTECTEDPKDTENSKYTEGSEGSEYTEASKNTECTEDPEDKKTIKLNSQNHQEPPTKEESEDTIATEQIKPIDKPQSKNRINTNISLNIELKKQLQVYGIMNNKTLSDILNESGEMYLKKFK